MSQRREFALTVVLSQHGPRFSERQRRRMDREDDQRIAQHWSCWVNESACGLHCVMAQHNGKPRKIARYGVAI